MNFNKSFYRPNTEATVEDAEKREREAAEAKVRLAEMIRKRNEKMSK